MATDNHEFRQPPYGQERWDHDWYDNFEKLDERVEIRGPETARENYEPHDNALFRATDTDNLFLGDGEQWVQIPSSGDNPTFGTVGADRVRVSEPPEQDTDVVRNIDLEGLDTGGGSFDHLLSETLDAQGNDISGVGTLQAEQSDAEIQTHSTEIDRDYTIPAGKGAVVSQELSGTGTISGGGNLTVIPESILGNPIGENVDAGGHAFDNVGSLNGGGPITDGDGTERQIWVSSDGNIPPDAADSDIVLTPSPSD